MNDLWLFGGLLEWVVLTEAIESNEQTLKRCTRRAFLLYSDYILPRMMTTDLLHLEHLQFSCARFLLPRTRVSAVLGHCSDWPTIVSQTLKAFNWSKWTTKRVD